MSFVSVGVMSSSWSAATGKERKEYTSRALQLENPSSQGVIELFLIAFGPIVLAYRSPELYLDCYIEFSPIYSLLIRFTWLVSLTCCVFDILGFNGVVH